MSARCGEQPGRIRADDERPCSVPYYPSLDETWHRGVGEEVCDGTHDGAGVAVDDGWVTMLMWESVCLHVVARVCPGVNQQSTTPGCAREEH
jgi:hypothetical protein